MQLEMILIYFSTAAKAQMLYDPPGKLVNCADLPEETTTTSTTRIIQTKFPIIIRDPIIRPGKIVLQPMPADIAVD